MIHSFSCKNFYSINDPANVTFLVDGNAPGTQDYFKTPSGARLSKVEAVVGPNASGKTSILKVLPFLKWLIVDSFDTSPDAEIPVQPFLLGNNENAHIELSVEFEVEGVVFQYEVALTREMIYVEKLKTRSKSTRRRTLKTLFTREWNDKENKYIVKDSGFNFPSGSKDVYRKNSSILCISFLFNHKLTRTINTYWQSVVSNVKEYGWAGSHATKALDNALSFFEVNQELKEKLDKYISMFDLGLKAIDIKGVVTDRKISYEGTKAIHLVSGKEEYLDLAYESSGTMQLVVILKYLLHALSVGGVAVIDEFDVNLHPEMVSMLLGLFTKNSTNPHNAQLFFSTHSILILNSLDKYQVVFTEKNEKGSTETWRLDEVEGVRVDDNFFAKYLAGAYGGIPRINS